jgi:hypothetical protein
MPGTSVKLGPFVGGLNTQSDPSSIEDNELVDCINFDLDLDGSLISRPPVVDVTAGSNSTVMGGHILCIGYGVFSGDRYYLFGCGPAGVGVYYNGTWSLIAAGVKSKSIVQFNNRVYILAKYTSSANGGWYNPDLGYTAVAAMPRGSSIVSYKSRLWVCAGNEAPPATGSRVWFSNIIPNETTWSAADFIDANPGDGQNAVDLVVYNDSLVIFKNDSTYTFPFDTDPANGILRKISGVVGATKDFCVTAYENVLYVYHEGWVYEMNNYVFTRINTKVPFVYEAPAQALADEDVYVCLFGDRLLVRYYRRIYVFGLRTRTWTRYLAKTFVTGPFVVAPSQDVRRKNQVYYMGSGYQGASNMYKTADGFDSIATEEIECSILTKNYDMGVSNKFKRLYWWGADVSSVDSVLGAATVVGFSFVTTWGDLKQYTWGALDTWGEPIPLNQIGTITTNVPTTQNRPSRVFVKFFKALRYRQINFQLKLTNDGTIREAPNRIYSLTAITHVKETVVKAVS